MLMFSLLLGMLPFKIQARLINRDLESFHNLIFTCAGVDVLVGTAESGWATCHCQMSMPICQR